MFCPVMRLAPGPQRKRTAAAMSEGSPRRPASARTSEWCCGSGCPAGRGAAITPGVTVFTLIFSGASSCASARVKPTSPALAVTTCGRRAAPGCAERRGEAADVDDRARPALLEMRQAGFDAVERAVEDHAGDRTPVRKRHRLERLLRAHRGIVDENVDAAEAGGGSGDHGPNRVGVGDIGGDGERPAALALGLAGDPPRLLPVRARIDDDRPPPLPQRQPAPPPPIGTRA